LLSIFFKNPNTSVIETPLKRVSTVLQNMSNNNFTPRSLTSTAVLAATARLHQLQVQSELAITEQLVSQEYFVIARIFCYGQFLKIIWSTLNNG